MHIIRLKRPWEKRPLGSNASETIDVPEPVRSSIETIEAATSAQNGDAFSYHRNFNKPSGLGSSCKVFLCINEWTGQLESVSVNQQPVDSNLGQPIKADITQRLQSHNKVELVLRSLPGQPVRLSGEVTLAIDE